MKIVYVMLALVLVFATGAAYAITWHAWGVHGATIDASTPGTITAVTGTDSTYHWNKSNWSTRIGQKAFFSTSAFNGKNVGDITGLTWTTTAGYWGNAYFNVMVEDINGKKAILSPSYNSATGTGWGATADPLKKSYCVFEAQAGWTGTSATGWYAATWDQVKNLKVSNGPFTEFPDTVSAPHATAQNDPLYSVANWFAWGGAAAGDGFLITFGQSTGPGNGLATTTISDFGITYVPEPASIFALFSGLAGIGLIRRKK